MKAEEMAAIYARCAAEGLPIGSMGEIKLTNLALLNKVRNEAFAEIAAAHEAEMAELREDMADTEAHAEKWIMGGARAVESLQNEKAELEARLVEIVERLETVAEPLAHEEQRLRFKLRDLELTERPDYWQQKRLTELGSRVDAVKSAHDAILWCLAAAPRELLWRGEDGLIKHLISYTLIDANTWSLDIEGEKPGEDGQEVELMIFALSGHPEKADSTEQVTDD